MKFLLLFCLVGITMAFPSAQSSFLEEFYNSTMRIHKIEAPSYAPPRPTYKPKPTDKPVKPDYKAPPPTQAPAPHIIKRREAPSYIPPPPPIHIYQQPQVEQLAAPFYNPPLKPSYNPPAKLSY